MQNLILIHNTTNKNHELILLGGFSLKKFGESSKRWKYDHKPDPKGIYFTVYNDNTDTVKVPTWAGIGNTKTLYCIPQIQKPYIVDFDEWKENLHAVFNTKGNGSTLTAKLIKKGYDSIITKHSAGHVAEIVLLHFSKVLIFNTLEEAKKYYQK